MGLVRGLSGVGLYMPAAATVVTQASSVLLCCGVDTYTLPTSLKTRRHSAFSPERCCHLVLAVTMCPLCHVFLRLLNAGVLGLVMLPK